MKTLFPFSKFFYVALLALLSLTQVCCDQSVGPFDGSTGENGYLVGMVTDPAGRALQQASIHIEHAVLTGKGSQTQPGVNGAYKIVVAKGLGQWVARGYVLQKFNGRLYKILLHPENADSFSDDEKAVRNFQWKLQGHVPDWSLNQFYGGTAELQRDPNSGIENNEKVLFTFEPVGSLIDGSQGKTLKLKGGKRGTQDYNFIHDIPIGKYKVTAIYEPTGEALLVTDSWNDGDYRASAIMEFFGTDASYRSNQMGIGFRER